MQLPGSIKLSTSAVWLISTRATRDERHHAVVRTIGVRLDLLSTQQRERYWELAIFPEDVEIPLATLEKLWARTGGFDEFDTEELCSRLNSFSLLWSYDANGRRHPPARRGKASF